VTLTPQEGGTRLTYSYGADVGGNSRPWASACSRRDAGPHRGILRALQRRIGRMPRRPCRAGSPCCGPAGPEDAMKPVAFEYFRPDTSSEGARSFVRAARAAGRARRWHEHSVPMLNLRMVRPKTVVDISRLAVLDRIELRATASSPARDRDPGRCRSTRTSCAASFPLLALALPWVGHFQTRNSGTLGGSRAPHGPSAEYPLWPRRERRHGGAAAASARTASGARAFFTGALSTRVGCLRADDDERATIGIWPRLPMTALIWLRPR